jgi:hypothetical protein
MRVGDAVEVHQRMMVSYHHQQKEIDVDDEVMATMHVVVVEGARWMLVESSSLQKRWAKLNGSYGHLEGG